MLCRACKHEMAIPSDTPGLQMLQELWRQVCGGVVIMLLRRGAEPFCQGRHT